MVCLRDVVIIVGGDFDVGGCLVWCRACFWAEGGCGLLAGFLDLLFSRVVGFVGCFDYGFVYRLGGWYLFGRLVGFACCITGMVVLTDGGFGWFLCVSADG